jgi:plasmid maintenance system antidote protein VapI
MPRAYPTTTRLGNRMALLGYTATEFASLTNIHPRTLTDILAGRRALTDAQAHACALVLGVPADQLV